jgi:hypothetical protein
MFKLKSYKIQADEGNTGCFFFNPRWAVKNFSRFICLIFSLSFLVLCLIACEKKQGKVEVSESKFILRQASKNTFTIDAEGKIKNTGDVDVKNVVVTGKCVSCSGRWGVGEWQFSPDIDRMPNQKDTINYIPAGGESPFRFEDVADFLLAGDRKPPELPEKLEIVILSYETVE